MPASSSCRVLWCGAQRTLRKWRPSHSGLHSCNASKHFNQTAGQKVHNRKRDAHTHTHAHTGGVGVAGSWRAMGQLNDAYKLSASALNAFVSMSLPRHELRFTHSHSQPALTHSLTLAQLFTLPHSHAKATCKKRNDGKEEKQQRTETSCSRERVDVGVGGKGAGTGEVRSASTWQEKTQFDLIKTNFRLWAGKICARFFLKVLCEWQPALWKGKQMSWINRK